MGNSPSASAIRVPRLEVNPRLFANLGLLKAQAPHVGMDTALAQRRVCVPSHETARCVIDGDLLVGALTHLVDAAEKASKHVDLSIARANVLLEKAKAHYEQVVQLRASLKETPALRAAISAITPSDEASLKRALEECTTNAASTHADDAERGGSALHGGASDLCITYNEVGKAEDEDAECYDSPFLLPHKTVQELLERLNAHAQRAPRLQQLQDTLHSVEDKISAEEKACREMLGASDIEWLHNPSISKLVLSLARCKADVRDAHTHATTASFTSEHVVDAVVDAGVVKTAASHAGSAGAPHDIHALAKRIESNTADAHTVSKSFADAMDSLRADVRTWSPDVAQSVSQSVKQLVDRVVTMSDEEVLKTARIEDVDAAEGEWPKLKAFARTLLSMLLRSTHAYDKLMSESKNAKLRAILTPRPYADTHILNTMSAHEKKALALRVSLLLKFISDSVHETSGTDSANSIGKVLQALKTHKREFDSIARMFM